MRKAREQYGATGTHVQSDLWGKSVKVFFFEVESLPKTEGGVEREFVKTMTLHVARRVHFLSLQNLHVLVGLKPTQRHIHIASPTLMAYRRAVRQLKLQTKETNRRTTDMLPTLTGGDPRKRCGSMRRPYA
jgi:hypothetical protein